MHSGQGDSETRRFGWPENPLHGNQDVFVRLSLFGSKCNAYGLGTALQQGAVDGCDAPLSVLYTNGFPDICKYIDNVNLFYSPLPVCVSTKVYNSLTPEDQKILKEAAVEAAKTARKNNDDSAARMEKDLSSKGMTIIPEKEVDSEGFRQVAKACYEEMESYIGSKWVQKLQKEVGLL